MLNLRPALGRFFLESEDLVRDRDAVAVVSHAFWQQQNPGGGWPSDSRTNVRVNGDAAAMMPAIRREIAAVDPAVPLSEDYPLEARVAFTFRHVRMAMTMLVSFAALSIVLAATGLYGVVAFVMSLRTREIAIRMALGARPEQVRMLVVRHGLSVAVFGAAIGLAAAVAGARLLSMMLYGVQPHDTVTFAAAAALLVGIAAVASGIPARRAIRVEPATALRRS